MTGLIFWESAAVFDGRAPLSAHHLCLRAEKEGVLTVMNGRGIFRFPARGGTVSLRGEAFAEGENRMVFRAGDRLYHVESLWREGDVLSPMGGDCMALLCEEKRKNEERWQEVKRLEKRLCLLEEAVFDVALFDPAPKDMKKEVKQKGETEG